MTLTAVYRTSDGKVFDKRSEANKWQAALDTKTRLTEIFAEVLATSPEGSDPATTLANFVMDNDMVLDAIKKGKPQPLNDPAVLSELGLTVPADDDTASGDIDDSQEASSEDTDDTGPAETSAPVNNTAGESQGAFLGHAQ